MARNAVESFGSWLLSKESVSFNKFILDKITIIVMILHPFPLLWGREEVISEVSEETMQL